MFGFAITVVMRTVEELERIIKDCPFSERMIAEAQASTEGECLYVAMLPEAPAIEGVDRLRAYQTENEELHINGRDIYFLFRRSVRNSKLADHVPKLGIPATMRNWNTMTKLGELAREMKDGFNRSVG